ncbi:MAG: Glutamate formiminotransferase @ Glutamate formyltransferase [uncultured Acidimicrobiales bacterium]|uniref:glutamate formimidoyltransferase n=1 Tax=uncultured Acidimicrobiales bacterium TaxID=310071 RepID=A0A6J4HG48_9ACTN|nr:MAG: Glutamate formiminotransferase @ Glutamate formyltransferase [uncultured Acidimicrobiales bacterium]
MLVCVVNVSAGRAGPALHAVETAAGDDLLDLHADPHHNRSVLTLLGEEAPRRVAIAALGAIDLRRHSGVHPRLGAVDVVPFVDLDGHDALAEAAAERYCAWSGASLQVPVFRYGGAAPDLPSVRRGAYRWLRPAAGPGLPHPTAGATAVGARRPLVAYNVWLAVPDLELARTVARAVRGPALRALGLAVGDRVQVSMNLVDPLRVGPAGAHDAVAARVAVAGAELVGLVPGGVLDAVPEDRWEELDLAADRTVEARITRHERAAPR